MRPAIPYRVALAAGLALLGCLAALAWYRSRSETFAVTGSVGLCGTTLQAGHPGGCKALRAAPSLVLVGPGGADDRHSRVFIVRGKHDRSFRVDVPRGSYSVYVLAGGSLIGARSYLAHEVQLDGGHRLLGTVTPADPWTWSGQVHVSSHGAKL